MGEFQGGQGHPGRARGTQGKAGEGVPRAPWGLGAPWLPPGSPWPSLGAPGLPGAPSNYLNKRPGLYACLSSLQAIPFPGPSPFNLSDSTSICLSSSRRRLEEEEERSKRKKKRRKRKRKRKKKKNKE